MNNAVVGLIMLGLLGILIYAILSESVIIKNDIPKFSFPKNSYTDSVGNTIEFFLPPEGNFTQQMSNMQVKLTMKNEPEIVPATEVIQQNGTGVTLKYIDTSPITIGVSKETYNGLTKVITSDESGVTKVIRGERAVIVGQIKLIDKIENDQPVYLKGPFMYHLLIECCTGDLFIYSNRPQPTDNNGYFTITYTTHQKNILGTYKITVETEDKNGKPVKYSTTFQLVD